MLIKIDRASIKRNPNAGATVSMMQGHREATFMFPEGGRIPAELLDKVVFSEWADSVKPEEGNRQRGYIINPDDADLFRVCKGIFISVDGGLQRVEHMPLPEYQYKHENPAIACLNCGEMVPVNDIADGVIYDGNDDEVWVDQICPHCHAYDTFGEIEYESIEDAIKQVKL